MISLTHKEFEKSIVNRGYEIFTQAQFNEWVELNREVLVKGEHSMLEDFEKSEYEILKEELRSFSPIEVVMPSKESKFRLEKAVFFCREAQVEWDEDVLVKGEDGEETLEKARSGKYTNTALNRKLGRVGNQYGSKKEGESDKEKTYITNNGKKFELVSGDPNKKGGTIQIKFPDGHIESRHSE